MPRPPFLPRYAASCSTRTAVETIHRYEHPFIRLASLNLPANPAYFVLAICHIRVYSAQGGFGRGQIYLKIRIWAGSSFRNKIPARSVIPAMVFGGVRRLGSI